MTQDWCTEADITGLVHAFYAEVREHRTLGPIFDARIADWDIHLATMVDFWSSVLRRTGRFHGSPMVKHAVIPDLRASDFAEWLALFRTVAARQENRAMADTAVAAAERIAANLWHGYQQAGALRSGAVPINAA